MPSNDGVTATPHTSHSYFDSTSSSFARSGAPIVLTLAFTSLARLSCRSRRTPRTRYRSTCRNRPTRLQVSIAPCTRHTSRTAPCCMACGPLERLSLSFRPPSRAAARRLCSRLLTGEPNQLFPELPSLVEREAECADGGPAIDDGSGRTELYVLTYIL